METMTNWLSWRVWVASVVGWILCCCLQGLPAMLREPGWLTYTAILNAPFLQAPLLLHYTQQTMRLGVTRWPLRRRLARWISGAMLLHLVWIAAWSLVNRTYLAITVLLLPSLALQYTGLAAVAVAVSGYQLAAAQRRELLTAQLRALRSQLQPHFLFNTLHAISVATRSDAATATRMLTLLGDLLRQTLRERDGELIALGEEQQMLQPYLELQQLRFADRLRVVVDIPAAVRHAAVPDLLLQPLVENALVHGIEQRPGGGTVRIAARRDGDRLVLEVADDGVGLPQTSDAVAFGTGLGATRARLQALFGDRADIVLAAGSAGGTLATLHLPYRELAHAG